MASGEDPFDRIPPPGQSIDANPVRAKAEGDHIAPAPATAPACPMEWRNVGKAAAAWCYRDSAGAVLRWTLRFIKPDGDKDIRPASLWRNERGGLSWRLKGEPGLRPLYGLERLAARPGAPVLLVEGEKTADAAAERFPGYVAMTWPGGANAVGKADFSPLGGRHVIVWPDADEPGRKAASATARAARAAGAKRVAIVPLPQFLPDKWDLADEWPAAFGMADAAELIADCEAAASEVAPVEWPHGFRMDGQGLWYDQPTQGGGIAPTRLSEVFEVIGEARDLDGGGWAVVLRFKDRDGVSKTIPVARARLAGGGAEVRAELAAAGLVVSPARGRADKFAIALAEVKCANRLRLVSATGWAGDRFILPREVVGPRLAEEVLFTGEAPALHYRRTGSLAGWRDGVAVKAAGNDLLTLALSLAFLGPLLRPLDLDGGGVHFRGPSSCGKTTLAQAAGSVWGGGGPLGFAQTWRTTANALEMLASGHNDGLLVLDELALVAAEEAGAAAYSLSSGQSKARSRSDGSLRQRTEWRVAILSTGEIGLADHIRASKRGERPMAGQELRLLDMPADAGAGMGVWQTLHGSEGPAALSEAIRAASGRDFGLAGPAFLEALIARRIDALTTARELLESFVTTVRREGDTGQAHRAAIRFGSIAVAGELATLFGVTGWEPMTAFDAAARLYTRWGAAFGRDRSRESNDVLRRVQAVCQGERASFAPKTGDDEDAAPSAGGRDGEARSLQTYGFREVVGGVVTYYFTPAGWARALSGHNPVDAARALDVAGYLVQGPQYPKRLQTRISVRGEKPTVYGVKGALVDADLGD